ncbi:MAG: YjjG family noncanonical pyrimidine nucleotidase [Oscillospiraceae bacterium]|nr:YjjG family noncanonical pyrimidine nucleotidase [Oscillospiraceae bacterium]
MITTILWDVDGTLLDFRFAEREAIKSLFREFGFGECTDEMLARYSAINDALWKKLEKKEVTRQQVLTGRFEQFFAEYGKDVSVVEQFNTRYQQSLGDFIAYCDDSLNIVKSLKGRVKQYVVSNATVAAQTKKLRLSGLGELMDGIFLSEELGVDKPSPAFFDKVFASISPADKSEMIIIGDSLSSDILGGVNAGILTCWYNPSCKSAPEYPKADYVISDLHEILELI